MDYKEKPVFFDHTGKRWRMAKWAFGITFAAIVAALAIVAPIVMEPAPPPGKSNSKTNNAPTVHELEAAFNAQNSPVVGRGQFIRAVSVDSSSSISDAFSGEHIRKLTRQEALAVGDSHYALERYGQIGDHTIVLTFDDGPDPKYTPPLLDTLSRQGVPAAFFVVGANVVKYPDLTRRIVKEGHVVANHTFSHIDFDFAGTVQGQQEINQTSRVMAAAVGRKTSFMRVPYAGATDQSLRASIKGILQAQRLGYIPVAYDYDTRDWTFASSRAPDSSFLDGSGKILLLHDSGGDRRHTIAYVEQLIPMAKKAGYSFVSLASVSPTPSAYTSTASTFADDAAFAAGQAVLVWPARLMLQLFALNVVLMIIVVGANITLATLQARRSRHLPRTPRSFRPFVSVVMPAYNEAAVLAASVRSVLAANYKNIQVVIVDDGSTDDTLQVARRLAARYSKVKVVHQRNRGKAAALNNGLRRSSGEIIICIDADTLFTPSTVWRLVRHFHNQKIGAVAGYVRVGNIRNALSRWQALEYATSIALERGAQAFLGAITVIPGACGAWRRTAISAAGGFSSSTLAEDCDVALAIHQAGYSIAQDTTAISYTECPLTLAQLAKQRFRWVFGNIQSYWKHRRMFFNKRFGWLGMLVLPNALLSVLIPIIFWPLLVALTIANIAAGRWWLMLLFLVVLFVLQFIVSFVGLTLAKEGYRNLVAVPLTRFVYAPLRTYILYRSVLTVLRGAFVGWDKLHRSNTAKAPGRARPFRATQPAAEE